MSATTAAAATVSININEKDMIKMIVEFMSNRDLNISMLDLERETGVINGAYSDDILFLRQLILDAQWDDVIEFIQPLKSMEAFNYKQFYYIIMKYQYLELLCLKCEANNNDNQLTVDQLVTYLNEIKAYCPSEDEYKKLCLLLTSARLQDHSEYRNWNPSSGRIQCFKEIYPLINKYLQVDKSNSHVSQNDRLFQLIVKGLLYESCVEYCQARATQSSEGYNLNDPNTLLMKTQLSETDASLLSWLHALPIETFSCPFEEKSLKINMDRFIKPNLEATWADLILATPIKPKQLFPYNAVPTGKSRNTEIMSRSLAPQYDGLSFGLNRSQIFNGLTNNDSSNAYAHQTGGGGGTGNGVGGDGQGSRKMLNVNEISRSVALFNLNDKLSASYMPELSTNNNQPATTNGTGKRVTNDAFLQSPKPSVGSPRHLNGIKEEDYNQQTSSRSNMNPTSPQPPQPSPQSPTQALKNSKTKLNDTSKDIRPITTTTATTITTTTNNQQSNLENATSMHDSALFKEYQKNKVQIMQQLEEQEKKREEYMKQLKLPVTNQSIQLQQQQQQQPQKGSINNDTPLSTPGTNKSTPNTNRIRPINETTKFDSLEDLTKSPSFVAVSIIEDQQAIRSVDVHPLGKYYAIGSNSKYLRVCQYPSLVNIKPNQACKPASVLYKRGKHHYGSIYCVAWNANGSLIATGSNDKTIKLIKFTPDLSETPDSEIELIHHNGTIRDLIFMQQEQNILVSGGAGDCKLYVTDCSTQQPIRVYTGHEGHIYTLYTWSTTSSVFVSGSQDKTCKFWDLRSPDCIQTINSNPISTTQGSPVASVAIDPSGQLLATGHEDSACALYDIRGSRIVQIYKPHTSDIRSVRFSSNAYYLLTASYDGKVIVTDLHGDLTKKLNWTVVAQHNDKIIQARWHPSELSFITTSADRTSIVWSLPTSNDSFI